MASDETALRDPWWRSAIGQHRHNSATSTRSAQAGSTASSLAIGAVPPSAGAPSALAVRSDSPGREEEHAR